jgi:hypothetical protein
VTHDASCFQNRRKYIHVGLKENIHVFHCFENNLRHESLGSASARGNQREHAALVDEGTYDANHRAVPVVPKHRGEVWVVKRGAGDEFNR